MEHSPVSLETLRGIVLAARGLPGLVFARVPVVELWTAKRVLDQGVTGVIFPFVSIRGWRRRRRRMPLSAFRAAWVGRGARHVHLARGGEIITIRRTRNILTIAMIEEAAAVERVDEMPPRRASMCCLSGRATCRFRWDCAGRQREPALDEAIAKVVAAGRRHGKFLGRPAGTAEQVTRFRAQGFQVFQSVTELGLIRLGAEELLKPLGIEGIPPDKRALY